MTTDRTRRCASCGRRKPVKEFYYRQDTQTYASYCRRCDADRVWERELARRDEIGESEWLAERAERQREYRRRTGNAYQKARRAVVTAMIHEHRDEFTVLRDDAAAEGRDRPYDVAREAFVAVYRDDIALRTQERLRSHA